MLKRRDISYEVWWDLKTFYNETLTDQKSPGLRKKDAKELATKYRTHPEAAAYSNVRIVKVRRTQPRRLN